MSAMVPHSGYDPFKLKKSVLAVKKFDLVRNHPGLWGQRGSLCNSGAKTPRPNNDASPPRIPLREARESENTLYGKAAVTTAAITSSMPKKPRPLVSPTFGLFLVQLCTNCSGAKLRGART